MPSPFVGMDPYLEHPAVFPDLHDNFIAYLREAVNAVLPPPYYANSSTRTWIEASNRPIIPDVKVLDPQPGQEGGNGAGGGIATMPAAGIQTTASEPLVITVFHDE